MIMELLFFDKILLYGKNLKQPKIQFLRKAMKDISKEAGYPIIECSNDEIIPVSEMKGDNQKLVIFDDFVCEKNQRPLIDYFVMGRHKNCSVFICLNHISRHQKTSD